MFKSALGHCEFQHFWQTLEDIILHNQQKIQNSLSKQIPCFCMILFLKFRTKEFDKVQIQINFEKKNFQEYDINSKRKWSILLFFKFSNFLLKTSQLIWFHIQTKVILLTTRIFSLNSGHYATKYFLLSSCVVVIYLEI